MNKISELATAIGRARLNPSLVQDQVYRAIDSALGGDVDIVDPSTPFNLLLSAGVGLHVSGLAQYETAIRQQYPELAQTYEDLYHHMSSWDYLDRFARPAPTVFQYAMSKDELISRMVTVPGSRIKQLIIPRNSYFTINNYVFTMLYPVVIRLMPYGGLEYTFDNSVKSPIMSLDSNVVEVAESRQGDREYVTLALPVLQFKIDRTFVPVPRGATFAQKYVLKDQYYYCRVWGKQKDGSLIEYRTTHSDQVYDPNSVTILLRVTDKSLEVRIPQIYITNQSVADEIRVDIFTSKGAINIDLSGFNPSNYVATYVEDDQDPMDNRYVAPLGAFNDVYFYCDRKVVGGGDGLSFEQLRERVVHNANYTDAPITDQQLRTSLQRRGFDILKSIDDINSRTYLATRPLPAPESGKFATGIGCSMESFQTNIDALLGYSTVADNGERVTIKPSTLFMMADNSLKIVSDSVKAQMLKYPPDVLVNEVNNTQYLYTPFHYVLDTSNNRFEARPYYMENPRVLSREALEQNETTLLDVAPDTFTLIKTDTGYRLTVSCRSGDSWKALRDDQAHLQLAFQPEGDTGYCFMNGVLQPNKLNGERVYVFDIDTNWDVTPKHSLVVNNFKMFNTADRELPMPLKGNWDLCFAVSDYDVYQLEIRELDLWMGTMLLPPNSHGISRHRINVVTGNALDRLWRRARNVAGSPKYAIWEGDVLATYETDIVARDADGKPKTQMVNGKREFVWEHRAGDPVIDPATGKQKVAHYAGTAKLDADKKPIKIEDRKTDRQFDIFMLDGVYYFTTDEADLEYARTIPQAIVQWIEEDIDQIGSKLFENTDLFFYPKRTLGYSRIIINNGREVSIPAGLEFHVTYHMSLVSYTNTELRTALAKNASKIISDVLSRNTVSVSDIISRITADAGNDVIGVKVDDFGPSKDISTYTAIDESTRCAIKRKLVVLPEGVLTVEEDLAFDFVNHKIQTIDKA